MRKRQLGTSDLQFSVIGFGTWALGGGGWKFSWGPQDDNDSVSAIHAALESGINWIDTAPAYGVNGYAEALVGRVLKDIPRAERPYIATKCGRQWTADRQLVPNLSADWIRQELEQSLQRLGVETIDLYQIHWPDPDDRIEEAWSVIADQIKQGKIRYAGVCNFTSAQIFRLQSIHPVTSLQPPYSMLRRDIEAELISYCRDNSMGIVVYSPLQKGLLTGAMTAERVRSLPQDDHRRGDPMFQQPRINAIQEMVRKLSDIAQDRGRTVAELALCWALRLPEITSAIVGGRRAEQISETARAGDWELDDATVSRIDDVLASSAGSAQQGV